MARLEMELIHRLQKKQEEQARARQAAETGGVAPGRAAEAVLSL